MRKLRNEKHESWRDRYPDYRNNRRPQAFNTLVTKCNKESTMYRFAKGRLNSFCRDVFAEGTTESFKDGEEFRCLPEADPGSNFGELFGMRMRIDARAIRTSLINKAAFA